MPPLFPPYKAARPPAPKRWLTAASLLVLLVGGGTALFRREESGVAIVIVAMFITGAAMGTLWLFHHWYYRGSVLNASAWEREVKFAQHLWWAQHQQQFGISEVVLIGPAGNSELDWVRVLRRESTPPRKLDEITGCSLRIARTFSQDVDAREKQLARMLVLQWKNQQQNQASASLETCYWAGSLVAWKAFLQQMKESFPNVVLPDEPKTWQGEETLAGIAEIFRCADPETQILIAGCRSMPVSAAALRPAGESAVLWLTGAESPALLTRGETFSLSEAGTISEVCVRAQVQSNLDEIPEHCVLFSQPDVPCLANSGWNIEQNLQDNYWGELGEMEALVTISLAAIYTRTQKQPCAWIATDPLHTLALGIVTSHG